MNYKMNSVVRLLYHFTNKPIEMDHATLPLCGFTDLAEISCLKVSLFCSFAFESFRSRFGSDENLKTQKYFDVGDGGLCSMQFTVHAVHGRIIQ